MTNKDNKEDINDDAEKKPPPRTRIPGGAAAKLMVVGPQISEDESGLPTPRPSTLEPRRQIVPMGRMPTT